MACTDPKCYRTEVKLQKEQHHALDEQRKYENFKIADMEPRATSNQTNGCKAETTVGMKFHKEKGQDCFSRKGLHKAD